MSHEKIAGYSYVIGQMFKGRKSSDSEEKHSFISSLILYLVFFITRLDTVLPHFVLSFLHNRLDTVLPHFVLSFLHNQIGLDTVLSHFDLSFLHNQIGHCFASFYPYFLVRWGKVIKKEGSPNHSSEQQTMKIKSTFCANQ